MAHERVCPWWMGYFLACPLRRFLQDPPKLIRPFVEPGMRVLEIGPGMGFFTLPLARAVGPAGKVFAVDVQKRMLDRLAGRALRAGLADRIECRLCPADSLAIDDLKGSLDFAFAMAVMHELPDRGCALREIHAALRAGAVFLIADPVSRFTQRELEETIRTAEAMGFVAENLPRTSRILRGTLLKKTAAPEARGSP